MLGKGLQLLRRRQLQSTCFLQQEMSRKGGRIIGLSLLFWKPYTVTRLLRYILYTTLILQQARAEGLWDPELTSAATC